MMRVVVVVKFTMNLEYLNYRVKLNEKEKEIAKVQKA